MYRRKEIINRKMFQRRQTGRLDKGDHTPEKEKKQTSHLIEEYKVTMYEDIEKLRVWKERNRWYLF